MELTHGTRADYQAGCRCDLCSAANAKYTKELREGLSMRVKSKRYESIVRVLKSWEMTGSDFRLGEKVKEIVNGEEDEK